MISIDFLVLLLLFTDYYPVFLAGVSKLLALRGFNRGLLMQERDSLKYPSDSVD